MLTKKELLKWFNSGIIQPYTLPKGHILIELLVHTPPPSKIIDTSGKGARMDSKIYPFAKILDKCENCTLFKYNHDSLVVLNSKLAHVKESGAYALWAKEYKNERPYKVPPPARYEGMIIEWQDRYHFPLNRFMDPTGADLFRFCIPEGMIKALISISDLSEYLDEATSTKVQDELKIGSVFEEMQIGSMKNLPQA